MKITCQACAAKYTIADDKVRGKTVKIKCKKCGASIVASGKDGESVAPAASAPAELYWTVNVGEGDQRSVSAGEIEQLLSAGYVNATSFAWRDGMSDWLPLSQVPELAGLFPESAEMSGTPEMSGLGQDHGDHGNREIDEDMPTKMERGASLLETTELLHIPQRHVFAFYNAALAMDLITADGSQIRRSQRKSQRNRGLLTRLFGWLHK